MITKGDKILINEAWLKACGRSRDAGLPWEVTHVQPTPGGEFLYHVRAEDKREWVVASWRGVTKIEEAGA